MLNEALDKRHKELKTLRTKHDEIKTTLLNKATFIKGKLIVYSVDRFQSNVCKRTTQRHEKKLDALIVNKHIMDGIKPNPNQLVTNLANFELSADEVSVLRLGLKHCLLVRPKESEMIAIVEDVWNQIIQRNALKDKHFAKHRVQTALKSFTYSYLDLDSKQFLNDQKHFNTIRQLRNKCMILKPDKGQGVVLIDKIDYYNSMERIFNDKTKFKVVNNDPTFRTVALVQNSLNTLVSRGELTENDKMEMRKKSARLGRAHGLSKIHKDYRNIPSFCPILDATCTVYYGVGKYLSNLLNPLTSNEYSLKDSFEATQRIHTILTELFAECYRYVLFDVVSLFTNVPPKKTIEIFLKRVFNDQIVQTKLKKRTLKKLLLDACQKTAFSFIFRFSFLFP